MAVLPLLAGDSKTLRVCADPNNLPFSNERGEGFENRLADLMARSLGAKLEFVWWSQRRGLVRNTLNDDRCDVLMGVPATLDSVTVTRPYYRSSYVFVSRKDRDFHIASLNDSRLEKWRIGIHTVGDDYAPPAVALARRGITANVTGYSLFGSYGEANPPSRLIRAVAAGDVDLAIVWGPFAGFFAKDESTPLVITPVSPASEIGVPFAYDIAIAVRRGNDALRTALDTAVAQNCGEVQAILREYGVPQVPEEGRHACEALRQPPVASWH